MTRSFPPDPAGPFKYDVAISFLHQDLEVAHAIEARLEPALRVFVYDRHAEDLLAADGMDGFVDVFRYESRLHVVLYRAGYGKTPWTRFELDHIKERFLLTQQMSAIAVNLDRSPIEWLPRQYLYLSDVADFAEAITVIKFRARELGALLRRLSPAEEAAEMIKLDARLREREETLRSERGVALALEQVALLFAEIVRHASEMRESAPDFPFACEVNQNGRAIFLVSGHVSTTIWWTLEWSNILQHSHLDITEIKGRVFLPSERDQYRGVGQTLRKTELSFDLTDKLEPCWTPYGRRDAPADERPSTRGLAERVVRRHMERYVEGEHARRRPLN